MSEGAWQIQCLHVNPGHTYGALFPIFVTAAAWIVTIIIYCCLKLGGIRSTQCISYISYHWQLAKFAHTWGNAALDDQVGHGVNFQTKGTTPTTDICCSQPSRVGLSTFDCADCEKNWVFVTRNVGSVWKPPCSPDKATDLFRRCCWRFLLIDVSNDSRMVDGKCHV